MQHRYVVVGAGAIGALMGARLHAAGLEVVLIARGEQLAALRDQGLLLRNARAEEIVRAPVAAHPSEVAFREGDTIVLATKTQDTPAVIQDLVRHAPAASPVFCAQNGLESERMALRFFPHVYGGFVYVPSDATQPGVVNCHASSGWGIIDIGCYPSGIDEHAARMAEHLEAAGFSSIARDDIMAWKRGKLVTNTINAVDAACGRGSDIGDIVEAARQEAEACFAAAGLAFVSAAEMAERAGPSRGMGAIDGRPFPGSSTWQSLARGLPTTEVDYLNGEVVLIGRQAGFPTPVNATLQSIVRELSFAGGRPGAVTPAEVRRRIEETRSAAHQETP